jgi:hypothetical protein
MNLVALVLSKADGAAGDTINAARAAAGYNFAPA